MHIKHTDTVHKIVGPMEIRSYSINEHFSGSLISISGNHGTMKNLYEDRIYFIISGEGMFVIDGVEHVVSPEDLIFVPKDTPYNIIGTMKYLLICSPAFNPADDVFLE